MGAIRWQGAKPGERPPEPSSSRTTDPSACALTEVVVCGVRFRNPVLAASGTFGYGVEFEKLVDLNALGGIVVKGLSKEPIAGNPAPRLWEARAGMINSVGLQNVGVRAFIADKLPRLRRYSDADHRECFRIRGRRLPRSGPGAE